MKRKKIIILSLLFASVISLLPPNHANATTLSNGTQIVSESEKSNQIAESDKTNFKMIKFSYEDTQYTYDSDGKSYKVIEHANEDFSNIESTVYVKNNNDYIVFSNIKTIIKDNVITVTTTKDSVTTVESENLPTPEKVKSFSAKAASDSLTDWEYSSYTVGTKNVKRYTVAGVVGVLTGIVGGIMGGPIGGGLGGALGSIAGLIVGDNLPSVYYGQNTWYKYTVTPGGMKLPRAERTFTKFYSDAFRTAEIYEGVWHEYYA